MTKTGKEADCEMANSSSLYIHLVDTDIVMVKADIGVSSIHSSRDTKLGELSAHIASHAGEKVQEELMAKKGQELSNGQVVETLPHQLNNRFKRLMFVCLYKWMEGNQEILQNAITECLTIASRQKYESVALPAIAMKGLAYPPYHVAMALVRSITNFKAAQKENCSLKTVYICLYKNEPAALKVFLQVVSAFMAGRQDRTDVILRGLPAFKGLETEFIRLKADGTA